MANLGGTYQADPTNVQGDYTPVPAGDYLVQIESSDIKDARKQGNRYIQLEMAIIEGPEAGRKLTDRLNLWNDNQQAVDIAQRSLNALCVAVSKMSIEDSSELHNIPMIATVKVDPAKPYMKDGVEQPGSPSNSIRTYKPRAAAPAAQAGGFKPAEAAAAPSTGGGLPWKNKQAA